MAVDLSFHDIGAGSPVVILHGLFGSRRNWGSIARRLGESRRVLTADLRNHGDSPWDATHDYTAMTDDVARLIESAVGGPAAVIGHSMGGKVAMLLALTRPELVDRLVAVDIPPAASNGTPVDYVRAMQAVPLATLARRTEVEAALAEAIPDPKVRAFLVTNVVSRPDGLAWGVNLDAIERQFAAIVGFPAVPPGRCFAKPSLFLIGERSDYVRPQHRDEIRRLFPGAEIEVVAGAGHWLHADAPEAFVVAVNRFLAA